mgnify:CR=1 FL=1
MAFTTKASIRTCSVLISISARTLSTVSKSLSLPLTIIDLVAVSSVIFMGDVEASPVPARNNSSIVVFANSGDI